MYKINRIQLYIALFIAFIAHITILEHIRLFGAKPDLMLIVTVFSGLFCGSGIGLEIGIVCGFLKDIYTLDLFWMNTFIMALSGFLSGVLSTKFSHESKPAHIYTVFALTLFSACLHFLFALTFLKTIASYFFEYLWISALPSAVYTSIIAIPIFAKGARMYAPEEYDDLI